MKRWIECHEIWPSYRIENENRADEVGCDFTPEEIEDYLATMDSYYDWMEKLRGLYERKRIG